MTKTIKTHIEQLKANFTHPDLQGLAVSFEEFITLYEGRHSLQAPEDFQTFIDALAEAQVKFTNALKRACTHYNMTPEQFAEYLENPKNFTTDQWEELQGIKRQSVELEPVQKSTPNKLKLVSKRI